MLRRLWSNGKKFTRLLLLDFLPPIHGPQQLHLSFRVSQQSFSEHAASRFRLEVCNRVPIMTPYCLGCPFIPSLTRTQTTPNYRKRKSTYQSICGSINCLDISNCSGVVTVLSFLTAYQMAPNHGYYEASLYAPRYLVRTSSFGLLYNSDAPTFKNPSSASPPHHDAEAYLDATPPQPDESHESTSYSDACWGTQIGNSLPDGTELLLYKFRSMSVHIITRCGGLFSWKYLWQRRTFLGSSESEIMATNKCIKDTIYLHNRATDLDMTDIALPTVIYNYNHTCYDWAKKTTTKGIKHFNLRENFVCE